MCRPWHSRSLNSVSTDLPSGWRVLFTRRWLGYFALAVAFAIACVCLGLWQFARLDEARAEVARISSNFDASPVPIATVLSHHPSLQESAKWLPVVATGVYLPDEQILVRSRPYLGDVGFEVLTPLKLDDGQIFIVNRGWVPAGSSTAVVGRVPAPPSGPVSVVARLKPSEPAIVGRSADGKTIPTIELDLIATMLGEDVITSAYGLLVSENPSVTDMPAPALRPEVSEGPHLSYALQWILFACMGLGGLLLAVRNERRIRNSAAVNSSTSAKSRRRRDEDEEDERIESRYSQL